MSDAFRRYSRGPQKNFRGLQGPSKDFYDVLEGFQGCSRSVSRGVLKLSGWFRVVDGVSGIVMVVLEVLLAFRGNFTHFSETSLNPLKLP